jgi:alkaline phosphatase D
MAYAPITSPSRRQLIASVAGALPFFGPGLIHANNVGSDRKVFSLGVGSGYPQRQSVVLWTRLAPEPARADGGLPPVDIPVRVQVARDPAMRNIVREGHATAEAAWAHSVHVEVDGLDPNRWYWYRFEARGQQSDVGRTRTVPVDDATPMRAGIGSCQLFEFGHYAAYRQMVDDDPDLIVHLGDYIYEGSVENAVRSLPIGSSNTLSEYRVRYAWYRSDPLLRRAHAHCPWLAIWDDHEVENDYVSDLSLYTDQASFMQRRAAAYQAYYEHMPLPASMRPDKHGMKIYGEFQFGTLARWLLLDGRQYRHAMRCDGSHAGGGQPVFAEDCDALRDPSRSFLGHGQRDWLLGRLPQSSAHWSLIAQPTVFAPTTIDRSGRQWLHTDSWDGYPIERERLLAAMADARVRNPVVFSGDVHVFYANSLHQRDRPDSPAVGAEFVCGAITTPPPSKRYVQMVQAARPSVRYANPDDRGYVSVVLNRKQLQVDMMGVTDITRPDSEVRRLARFVLASGQSVPHLG